MFFGDPLLVMHVKRVAVRSEASSTLLVHKSKYGL